MITLHLSGQMAKDYGDSVVLDAKSPREAVLALSFQCPKYKDTLISNDWHIYVGQGNDISEKELDMSLGSVTDVYLLPRIQGANGAVNFVVGAVLFVIGAVLTYTGVGSPLGVPLMSAGAGLMVGGIIQMTTKIPGAEDLSRDSVDQKASYLFSGPTNTATQGVAIPRGYGRMLVGSVVVSVALYAEQIGNFADTISFTWPSLVVGEKMWTKYIN